MRRDIAKWEATRRKGMLTWMANAKPRRPIRAVSAKRARENRERAKLRPQVVGGPCAARLEGCTGIATDWHERKSRARGGAAVELENSLGLCRFCHSWAHEHPREARELGLLRHSWEVA